MTTETILVWNPLLPEADWAAVDDYVTAAVAAGKTDSDLGVVTYPDGLPGVAPKVVNRTWTTLADAQDWITFISQYNPQSAIIV
jgi:hypothetical protein